MSFVLTVVASDKPLSAGHLAGIERFLDAQGLARPGDPVWLAPHKAADIPVSARLTPEQMRQLWDALAADRIDVFCTSLAGRRKKLLLADMDSTIVTSETLDELAAEAGIGEQVAEITARAMNGELDFKGALRERVGLLKGLSTDALKTTLTATEISPGAGTLVQTMRANGAVCVLVSGGFTFFTGAVAGQLGFSQHHGNVLNMEDGVLAGTVGEPILDKTAKLDFLKTYTKDLGLSGADSLSVGDGANDLPMLEAAGLGIGYRPKPLLRDSLDNCVFYSDLTALLYVQGYGADDFSG